MFTQTCSTDGGGGRQAPSGMLLEVDFKWLMAGQGCEVDPERLRHDPDYADSCIRRALDSRCEPLHACANHLREALQQAEDGLPTV